MIPSTGILSLDRVLGDLRLGDNVVWQVDDIEDYRQFVAPYIKKSLSDGRNLIYIRFAEHSPLVEKNSKVKIHQLNASIGFEAFTKEVHSIIAQEGLQAFYIFDCLSDLLSAWASDLMIGNFFLVTCPFLFRLDTIAYFAILRNQHSFKTIAKIRETTQLLLDVHDIEGKLYVQPLKVWNRYSPTMFLPHVKAGEEFLPITSSADIAKLFSRISGQLTEGSVKELDFEQQIRVTLGKEARMLDLIRRYLTPEDLAEIRSRLIGTGFIGGKALGMYLARKILSPDWQEKLEPHDSFYIGSDVFYSYIVENGWWELWLEQKTEKGYFKKAAELREKLLNGKFSHEVREQFLKLIEYYGQAPIIVRSSSLLEDAFGNAFAGKYESIFIVNQGSPEERYQHFEDTVRRVYASTMNEEALNYRLQRGLSQADEQMALLVQRVSGSHHRHYFFPYVAGVGFSYNTFVWHKDMDPKAGMLRLVFGLGTRAVNRVEGDYPRIVALDAPLMRPYAGMEKTKRFSQHDVDILDIEQNELRTVPLPQIVQNEPELDLEPVASRDREAEEKLESLGQGRPSWVLTFDKLLSATGLATDLKKILKKLEDSYQYPVDMEFTVNFEPEGKYYINLVQCRPLQARGGLGHVDIPKNIKSKDVIFSSEGNFMGGSVSQSIGKLIFVDPKAYGELLMSKKFDIARLIGKLNQQIGDERTLLIGPGRWGSRDATLGVPVNFAEINRVKALIEIDDPEGGFMPELSFGSHFFLDLVEADIFYAALFMENKKTEFDIQWLRELPNRLSKLIPEADAYEAVLKVCDFKKKEIKLLSDLTSQKVVCLK